MKNNCLKFLSCVLAVLTLTSCLASCSSKSPESSTLTEKVTSDDLSVQPGTSEESGSSTSPLEVVDYVAQLKLDMNSDSAKQEVTVKTYVDGDTTHFNVPKSMNDSGVLKARYLAINTPESTGKIEEFGKTASRFTHEKLSNAVSIIVESDNGKWNLDSTGGRYLVWVWYKPSADAEYRNLNLEILQNGLAIASNTSQNRYGTTCVAALNQAKAQKLYVHSGQKDPDMYYGEAVELTLKELRTNIADYDGIKVAFEGVITLNNNNTVYVEEYDAETNMYYGISVYYGYNLSGDGLEILKVGNRTRIVGTVQYYEAGGTYQVSDLSYRTMKPDDPNNIQKISDGHSAAYFETDANTFVNGKVSIVTESEDGEPLTKELPYASLAMSTSLSMNNLQIVSIYTTKNEESSSYGAMTFTCKSGDVTVSVRTTVFRKDSGELYTAEDYEGKNINIKGIVDFYENGYQILVLTPEDITFNS